MKSTMHLNKSLVVEPEHSHHMFSAVTHRSPPAQSNISPMETLLLPQIYVLFLPLQPSASFEYEADFNPWLHQVLLFATRVCH